MNISPFTLAVSLTLFVVTGCNSAKKSQQSAKDAPTDSLTSWKQAQAWLDQECPALPQALENEARLKQFQSHWNNDAFAAAHAAYVARTGSAYAKSGDVIRAVSAVESSLTEFAMARKRFPNSTILRMSHAITLSNLPAVFLKREAAHDSLNALLATPSLSAAQQSRLRTALQSLQNSKE
jgi:hypothetical protein